MVVASLESSNPMVRRVGGTASWLEKNVFIYLGGKLKTESTWGKGYNGYKSSWWFQIFFIFIPTGGRFPIWLLFFKWVETTNQVPFFLVQPCDFFKFHVHFVSTKNGANLKPRNCPALLRWSWNTGMWTMCTPPFSRPVMEKGDQLTLPQSYRAYNNPLSASWNLNQSWFLTMAIKHGTSTGMILQAITTPWKFNNIAPEHWAKPQKGSRIMTCQVPSFSRGFCCENSGGWPPRSETFEMNKKTRVISGHQRFLRNVKVADLSPKTHFRRLSDTDGTLVASWI